MKVYTNGFIYDDKTSDDFGLIICEIEGNEPSDTSGGEIEITKIESPIQNRWYKSGNTNYTGALQFAFQVCKSNFKPFDSYEYSSISRWLCRKDDYKDFMITRGDYDNIHFFAQFNISPVEVAGNIVGITVTGITDSPFAYSQMNKYVIESNGSAEYTIFDLSDEIGYIYPDIEIEVTKNCDISITNTHENRIFTLNNCVANEIIKIDGKMLQMSTNANRNLYADINYIFPRIANDYDNRKNIFRIQGYCVITMRYREIRKVVV